jgi:hypothetical integral membrane protein (TIGR02206 family)
VTPLTAGRPFQAFSGQHWLLLGLFAVGVVLVARWGHSHRGTQREIPARRSFAVLIAAIALTMQVYYQLEPGGFDLGESLPVQLCDVATVTAVVALWSRSRRAAAFTYYVALTLSVQGILTPALEQGFPSPRFFGFFALHFLVVWSAVYLTWGLGMRPSWRLYGFTCAATSVWVGVAFVLNALLGTNYGYLDHKPSSGSLLDLLGPWPVYVLLEVAIVAAGWALVLTWPWQWHRDGGALPTYSSGRETR